MPGMLARVRLAGKALTGLFTDASATEAYGLLAGVYPSGVGAVPQRGTRELLEAYGTMPWLRAVSAQIAEKVSATEWQLFAPAGRERPRMLQRASGMGRSALIQKQVRAGALRQIESHLLLDALHAANSYMIGAALTRVYQIHMDLVGEAFWIKERNALLAPVAFWPVPPHWVVSTPTTRSRTFNIAFQGWGGEIPDTEMVWFADLDPANPYGRGVGLARSLADELETDEYAARHTRMTFINRARPDLIIWPEETKHDSGVISSENAQRLAVKWRAEHQGFWKAALPFFATRKLGVHELNQSFKELDLIPLRQMERDTIRQVFGIPPEMMGIIGPGSARATIETGEYIFEKHVIQPRREFLRAYLQERIIPEYDERLVLSYRSTVEADREFALKAAEKAPWSRTVDEWRQLQDLEPLPDGRGQVHIMPVNVVPVRDPTVPPPSPFALGTPAGREPVMRDSAPEASGEWSYALKACLDAGDAVGAATIERQMADDLDDLPDLSRRVGRRETAWRRWWADQLTALRDRVNEADWMRVVGAGQPQQIVQVVPVQSWGDGIRPAIRDILKVAWWDGAHAGAEAAGIEIRREESARAPQRYPHVTFNRVEPEAVAWATGHAGELINATVNPASIEGIRAAVIEALQQGWGAEKTARVLRESIGLTARQAVAVVRFAVRLTAAGVAEERVALRVARYALALRRVRSLSIARTELITAGNTGQQRLWGIAIEQGVLRKERMRKRWLATNDAITEQICEGLASEEPVGVDEPFSNGQQHPPAHPACRCSVGLVMAPEAARSIEPVDDMAAIVARAMQPFHEAMAHVAEALAAKPPGDNDEEKKEGG